ncbi:magnesium transporter CorA [Apibacter muscae]|uniref:Magnesium transporter CorA n=1 Tax=Apibacter muscae TaxID=2509004 RepID=A0A563DEK1_9FLAO|nr:CorA family divalent cation transporter [Apibacter muscae]TWP28655.1 magnesium transporter CorA [Apibacter muscae]
MPSSNVQQTHYEWIDLQNPNKDELQEITLKYNLNYYNLTDSLEPNHLPKYESGEDINFLIVRIVNINAKKEANIQSITNKIAIFYNDKVIITVHRVKIDFLLDIKLKFVDSNKAKTTLAIIIKILSECLQSYNQALLGTMNKLESYENNLFASKNTSVSLKNIYSLKRKTSLCSKLLILSDNVICALKPNKSEKPEFQDLKDLYTKLTTLHEQVSDDLNNLLNLYISLSSQKTNEIMKTLTIFSIFFMPLTFIAGIYGMNFSHMPELQSRWGYPIIMIVMVVITILIYFWLKRKKWL